MQHSDQPYRSVLYMPGSKPRALEKARTLAADALILDLEDAVTPAEKPRAREVIAEALAQGGYGMRRILIRVNHYDTEWGPEDLVAAAKAAPHAVLLPKVEKPEDIQRAAQIIAEAGAPEATTIWAMMETPRGVLNAAAIAGAHDRLEGFVMGTNDLAKDLGAAQTPDRIALVPSLAICLLAARAEGLIAVDGVYNAIKDADGLRAACRQGKDLGFDGKTLIHPDQLAVANEVFAPSAADVELAQTQVAAFEEAEARGEGVAVVNGRIVENLHVVTARKTLARAAAIAAMAAAAAQ